MRVTRIGLRDFRNYEAAEVELGEGLTVVAGPNGAGKTNLLEALYFGCTARSPRTSNERELVRRGGEGVARVVLDLVGDDGEHRIEVGFQPGEAKHVRVDDSPVDNLSAVAVRPLASVFLPERLELVKGAPAARRAHLDQVVAALWPNRVETRSAYSRALAQRNALVARLRAGAASVTALDAWDAELARHGIRLMADRAEAIDGLRPLFSDLAASLGLPGEAELRYRPRSAATDADALAAELAERRQADLDRGFTAHGPHRDELQLLLGSAPLRAYGSQGQQRAALLALLFAERALLAERRARLPLMLLDDVMSELDAERRELLADLLRSGGQAVVTATEPEHVPGTTPATGGLIRVEDGVVGAATRAGSGVRRLAPRALSLALDGVVRGAEPTTLLARVQAVWADVAGPGLAGSATPVSEREGVVTVACESAVWAQELELLGPDLITRFAAALAGESGRPPAGSVKKLRFVVGSPPNQ